jgi:Lrp/AsnC family transcriptional regulator
MDDVDRRILTLLQPNATLTVAQVADKIGITQTPCWRRIQKLWEEGVIRRQVTLVDPGKVRLGLTAFVLIRTGSHTAAWAERFLSSIQVFPQVIEVYRLSGDIDYMLKVVASDVAAYDEFYKRLIRSVDFASVSSSFAMETIKATTVLPLDAA